VYNRITWDKFNPKPLEFIRRKGKSEKYICADFVCLDTETSHTIDNSIGWVYHWAFSYGDDIIFGRRPSELCECLDKIKKVNNLYVSGQTERKMIIFVHNLSYDYDYIKEHIKQKFGVTAEQCETLATSKHSIITWSVAGFEFRCTYKLTHKSLDTWSREMGVSRKLTGTVDHTITRYQDTPMSDTDIEYLAYDIISLKECILKQMKLHGHNILTVPYTVTGYVRKDTFKEFRKNEKQNRQQFKKESLSYEVYQMCKRENAGGITHGNRYMANITQRGVIRHRDFVSHYPTQQITQKAPCGHFAVEYLYSNNEPYSKEKLTELGKTNCFLADILVKDLTLKGAKITMPYAQYSKFYEGRQESVKFVCDNGRILKYKGVCKVTVNEIDWQILCNQYNFDVIVVNVVKFKKSEYPEYLQNTVKRYFYNKTEYKDKEKALEKQGLDETPEWVENHALLMISKGLLNGIFGMSDTDPVHIGYVETNSGEWVGESLNNEDIANALAEYYDKSSSFMSYQLGVWTTANARKQLLDLIELIGYDNFIYCDTDSIFYYSTPEIESRIESYNENKRKECDEKGWFVEVNGRKVYFNQFDLEDEDIISFRFLHAKCYAYEVKEKTENSNEVIKLKSVIAGVRKFGRNGNTRNNELSDISELHNGKVFKDCGGTLIQHNYSVPTTAEIDGHLTEFASSAVIFDSEKTLHSMWSHHETFIEYEKSIEYI
jgi:hypothetical protein